ncbi:MAG TPA: hypothetical protein VGB24_02605 [Longimicrobium sp.]|uniref:hypothetical protein n=1 Tax=Longimicrobium sp. TaxID=2029185 RepID=UPI002EDAD150
MTSLARLLIPISILVGAACGKDGTGTDRTPEPPVAPSFVEIASDPGDFVGRGQSYRYTKSDAVLAVQATGGKITVRVEGDQQWDGEFILPSKHNKVVPGTFTGLSRSPFHDPAAGGLSWAGEGRGCNKLSASLTVERATYEADQLTALELRFEQHCEGSTPALRGRIQWSAADPTIPPGPVNPPPSTLWRAAPGLVPATGNYVYLQSDVGDFIAGGRSYTYPGGALSVTTSGGLLSVVVTANESWRGDFQAMNSLTELKPGYYGDLRRYPFHNRLKGGMAWGGEGRGCNMLTGWFVVDQVTYAGGNLTEIALRFEQHCEGGGPALRGQIRWSAADVPPLPLPVNPPPSTLWRADAAAVPASGSYVYLKSDAGDFVGGGRTHLYQTGAFSVSGSDGLMTVTVAADENWRGEFKAMNHLTELKPGYYGDLRRYPFHNPLAGGLAWSGQGRGCNTLSGWFVVDRVVYTAGKITDIELRFEQHCEGGGPALRGQIRWSAADVAPPPEPVNPPPSTLWRADASAVPASGSYVYLKSDAGDFVGGGRTYLYQTGAFSVSSNAGLLTVTVAADENWRGEFKAMNNLDELKPGYYGDLRRYPFHNPLKGGLSWGGQGGCNTLTGWFVVDRVTYTGGNLSSVELRFEQHCEGGGPALRGQIRWSATDVAPPPEPVNPPPSTLWRADASAVPASGSYVYLKSDAGDFVGGGRTHLYQTGAFSVSGSDGLMTVTVAADENWRGEFKAMNHLTELKPGYYGDLRRYPFHNPLKGGLDWGGQGRGCNTLSGWFVVDRVVYTAGKITEVELRFEQHCEGGGPALRGQIRWSAPAS